MFYNILHSSLFTSRSTMYVVTQCCIYSIPILEIGKNKQGNFKPLVGTYFILFYELLLLPLVCTYFNEIKVQHWFKFRYT